MPLTNNSSDSILYSDPVTRGRALTMVGHGSIGILLGLLMGYGLIFSVLERIEIWPFLSVDAQIPGRMGAWRAAHTGPIMNGLLCIAGAVAISFVPLSSGQQKFITWGLVFTVWANFAFYVGGIFGNAHSLTGGTSEKFGEANLFDLIGFLPALVGAVITPACMFVVARAAFKAKPSLEIQRAE